MKLLSSLLGCLLVLATVSTAFAAEASTNAAPMAPAPAKDKKTAVQAKSKAVDAQAVPVTASAPKPSEFKFDDYLKELADTLKLTDEEKKDIQTYYLADGMLLKNILNNDTLSPLQQAQQVSDVRDVRNTKIVALLQDADRQRAFLKVEAQYRVALTELAADGGLVSAPPSPPAPANPAPAQSEKSPVAKGVAK